jgi:gas vesicle protein
MKAFLAGLGIGVGLGLVLAPDRGDATRAKIKERVGGWGEGLSQKVDSAKRAVSDQVDRRSRQEGEQPRSESRKGPSSEGKDDAINTLTREELMEVNGIGPVLADRIISGRPYRSHADLVERGILAQSTLDEFEKQFGRGRKRPA